jgi:hypothetical protein
LFVSRILVRRRWGRFAGSASKPPARCSRRLGFHAANSAGGFEGFLVLAGGVRIEAFLQNHRVAREEGFDLGHRDPEKGGQVLFDRRRIEPRLEPAFKYQPVCGHANLVSGLRSGVRVITHLSRSLTGVNVSWPVPISERIYISKP